MMSMKGFLFLVIYFFSSQATKFGLNLKPSRNASLLILGLAHNRRTHELFAPLINENRGLEIVSSFNGRKSLAKVKKCDFTNFLSDDENTGFNHLKFNVITRSILPYEESGIAITGHFHSLFSDDSFNGIAIQEETDSTGWKIFTFTSNSTSIENTIFATHSSFPTKETWYTVLSTVPIDRETSSPSFVHFDGKTGEFTPLHHPMSEDEQRKYSAHPHFLTIYKTNDGGDNWDQVLEIQESSSYMRDFQCFDDITCVALIQRVDNTAVVLMTKDGGKTWQEIFRNEAVGVELKSVFVQARNNIWIVGEDGNNKGESVLYHSVDGGAPWNVINPEMEGLEKIFFYNGGMGATDDDYRYVEGLIVTNTKEGKQLLQQIVADL
eukprot:gene3942-4217_t